MEINSGHERPFARLGQNDLDSVFFLSCERNSHSQSAYRKRDGPSTCGFLSRLSTISYNAGLSLHLLYETLFSPNHGVDVRLCAGLFHDAPQPGG